MLEVGVTNPQTAWIASGWPLFVTLAVLLLLGIVFRGRAHLLIEAWLYRRAVAKRLRDVPPMLEFTPQIIRADVLVTVGLVLTTGITLVVGMLAPIGGLGVVIAVPITALLIWLIVVVAERRYVAGLNRTLTNAVGRLESQLRSGNSFQSGIRRVIQDMPAGSPLVQEWLFLERIPGTALGQGRAATLQEAARALQAQTPSLRHQSVLSNLAVALEQPQDVQIARLGAMAENLQTSERRASEIKGELAQIKYSGIVVGLVAIGITVYLSLVQLERFIIAYTTPWGILIVAPIIILAISAPIIGGWMLSQVEDVE
jgi:hypothetical protein